jgi:hypothetical protein
MEGTLDKPHVFVGSSSEELTPARTIAAHLEDVAFPKVWKDSQVFKLGNHTLEDLINELDQSMFGIFVLSPDDLVSSRGTSMPKSRDNVVFELGLFMGRLGRQRTFMVVRHDPNTTVALPSDLQGIKYATYRLTNNDVSASVASACQAVRVAMQTALISGTPSSHSAENALLVDCNLSNVKSYHPPQINLTRDTLSKINLRMRLRIPAPSKQPTLTELHVCYPQELETYFVSWSSRLKAQDDEHAKNLRYYWLTREQLKYVTRGEGFNFLINAKHPGDFEIVILATMPEEQEPLRETIKVHVE